MERLGGDTCLNDGWRLFGERRGLLMAVGLLVWCIEGIFFVPIALYDPRVGPALWLALVASLVLVVPLHVGLQSLALAVARGRPCSFATAFIGFPRFGRLMGISFVTALRLLVALLPLGGALALWSFVGTRSAVWLFVIGVLGGGISLVLGGRVAMRYRYAGILALEDGTGVLTA